MVDDDRVVPDQPARSIDADVRFIAASGRPLESLEDVERRHIARVLEHTDGNRSEAARILGIGRTTLYDKIARYGLGDTGRREADAGLQAGTETEADAGTAGARDAADRPPPE